MVILCLTVWGTAKLFSQQLHHLKSYQKCTSVLISPHPVNAYDFPSFFKVTILTGVQCYLTVVLIWFPSWLMMLSIILCACDHLYIFLEKCLFKFFEYSTFQLRFFCVCLFCCEVVLVYIFQILDLITYGLHIFSTFIGCLSLSWECSLMHREFYFDEVQFMCFLWSVLLGW